jgi:hypothetical protein
MLFIEWEDLKNPFENSFVGKNYFINRVKGKMKNDEMHSALAIIDTFIIFLIIIIMQIIKKK